MRKSMLVTLSAVFILLTCMISCDKIGIGPDGGCEASLFKDTSFIYKQTQCADVWGYGKTDSSTALMAYRYLDSLSLLDQTSRFMIIKDSTQLSSCLSCTCPSGKLIRLITERGSADTLRYKRLRELGFK